jgi:hypothetical protein
VGDEIGDATVERVWEDGMAVSFARSPKITKYCDPNKEQIRRAFEFARMDYELVHGEAMNIKSCRANIFTGTLGIIGAAGIAILGILGIKDSASWQNWLPLAALIPIGLLTSAIFATIHKARKLNMRAGYLETLGEYLANGLVPPHFCGWTKAKIVLTRCRIYLRAHRGKIKGCEAPAPVQKSRKNMVSGTSEMSAMLGLVIGLLTFTRGQSKKERPRCADEGKMRGAEINSEVQFWPGLLDSFTSLTTYIYTIAFVLAVSSLLWCIKGVIQSRIAENFSPVLYLSAIVLGGIVTGGFGLASLGSRYLLRKNGSNPRGKGKETLIEMLFKCYKYFAGLVVPILLLGLVTANAVGISASRTAMGIYVLGGVISAVALCIGFSCYDKVNSLRRGRYSAERWRHIWKLCFEYCPLMDAATEANLVDTEALAQDEQE